jgi:rhodanese-related sulfurtransferase
MLRFANLRQYLIGLGVAVAFAVYLANTTGSGGVQGDHGVDYSHIHEVTPAQATQLIDSGALVVDVRGQEAYAHRHIPGAVLMPLEDLQAAIAKLTIARDHPIVVYCGDGVSHGPEGTAILNQAGFANAVNLKGGIDGWQGEKRPIARS